MSATGSLQYCSAWYWKLLCVEVLCSRWWELYFLWIYMADRVNKYDDSWHMNTCSFVETFRDMATIKKSSSWRVWLLVLEWFTMIASLCLSCSTRPTCLSLNCCMSWLLMSCVLKCLEASLRTSGFLRLASRTWLHGPPKNIGLMHAVVWADNGCFVAHFEVMHALIPQHIATHRLLGSPLRNSQTKIWVSRLVFVSIPYWVHLRPLHNRTVPCICN